MTVARSPAPRAPLRGRYLVHHPLWNTWLRVSDAAVQLLAPAAPTQRLSAPRRLLLAVGGHLGDAVIATSAIAAARGAWPEAEVGIVTGSWNRRVFERLDGVKWLHEVDHWKLNRGAGSWWARATRAISTSRDATREIAAVGYDTAVDLYPYYPNASLLLRRAGIPTRIGYASGGGGGHYTRALEWSVGGHASSDHFRLLAELGVTPLVDPTYRLPPLSSSAVESARARISAAGADPDRYVVFHPGAGTAQKQWPERHWTDLAEAMHAKQLAVVLTGAGARDRERVRRLAGVAGTYDVCDQLAWDELRATVRGARAVVSVDTVTAHLSAAEGTPTLVLATGIDDPRRWRPLGRNVVVFTEAVPCSPCNNSAGCDAMTCIRGVASSRVLAELAARLDRPVEGQAFRR